MKQYTTYEQVLSEFGSGVAKARGDAPYIIVRQMGVDITLHIAEARKLSEFVTYMDLTWPDKIKRGF